MPACVPIKELKNTTEFAATVEASPEPVIVTRNGREAFAVMTVDKLDALRMEAARAELYRTIAASEADIEAGRVVSARDAQREARERYGC